MLYKINLRNLATKIKHCILLDTFFKQVEVNAIFYLLI